MNYGPKAYTIIHPEIKISDLARKSLLEYQAEEGQVIVHVMYLPSPLFEEVGIRIWPTTYLVPHDGGIRGQLVSADNIAVYPNWQFIKPCKPHYFTLLFTPLPKNCRIFNLIEEIPQPNGFQINNIQRNQEDVYEVQLLD